MVHPILGIRLFELQKALCQAWHLPELLNTLMDDANAHLPRVQNVTLAVNLARHSTNNWSDAALPDDLAANEKLLHINRETLLNRLDIPEELAAPFGKIGSRAGWPVDGRAEAIVHYSRETRMAIGSILFIGAIAVAALYGIVLYNGLVALKHGVCLLYTSDAADE